MAIAQWSITRVKRFREIALSYFEAGFELCTEIDNPRCFFRIVTLGRVNQPERTQHFAAGDLSFQPLKTPVG